MRPRFAEAEVLVAEHDGRIVGTIAFYADVRHEGWSNLPAGWAGFRALAVAPRMRGAGIGKALVQHCIERTRNVGAETLGIHTISLLTDAVRLYQRLGFVRCPEFDLRAADIFPSENADETVGLAFRLDVESPGTGRKAKPGPPFEIPFISLAQPATSWGRTPRRATRSTSGRRSRTFAGTSMKPGHHSPTWPR